MAEVKRVTTAKKSNKLIRTLLIVAGVLGLALILVAVYFYAIKPSQDKVIENKRTCACYYLDPAVASECGDPRKGFMFKTSEVTGTQSCISACQVSQLPITELKSTTKQELFLSCPIQSLQDTRCKEMVITDENGKVITGQVQPDDKITVVAKFDKTYKNAEFRLNNTPVKADKTSDEDTTIEKTFSNFTTPALDIVATAEDSTGERINSPLCKRILTVEQTGSTAVTSLLLEKRTDESEKVKISQATIKISNVKEGENTNIHFTFGGDKFSELTMTKGFVVDSTKGSISILEQELYKDENFKESLSFSQFNDYFGELKVTAEVLDGEVSLGKASTNVTFTKKEVEPPVQPEPQPQPEPPQEEEVESNFAVTTTVQAECVDRVEPNNSAIFSITVKNNSTVSQKLLSVKNKLPLGFVYLTGSTTINEVAVTDSNYLQVNTVGQTQELSFTTRGGWSVKASEQIVLTFKALAGESALTGENMNEVVIEPAQVPTSPDTLRASATLNVVQTCIPTTDDGSSTQIPETGIFDNVIVQIVLGILVLLFGWYIYTKPFGQVVIKKFVDSNTYKGAEMGIWRIFKPKKYFEEAIVKETDRKKK